MSYDVRVAVQDQFSESEQQDTLRAVVSGGCGFVGSYVVDELTRRGARVLLIDSLVHGGASIMPRDASARLLRKDIRSLAPADVTGFEQAYWFHLAALPFIPASFVAPEQVFSTNVLGTFRVCEMAAVASAKRLVHVSTCEVYTSDSEKPLREDSRLDPLSPYANSKLCAEVVVKECVETLDYAILRLFNTYGPRVTHPYFIPEMVRQALTESTFKVGRLETRRDFTFVEDAARAVVDAAFAPDAARQTINVGSGRCMSMREVLEAVREETDTTERAIMEDPSRARPAGRDPLCFVADAGKAASILNWTPTIDFGTGIERTVAGLNHAWQKQTA